MWELPLGLTRNQGIEIFNRFSTGKAHERLGILTESLGPEGQPAIVVVEKPFHYSVSLEQEGLQLPGGTTIRYASIRGLTGADFTSSTAGNHSITRRLSPKGFGILQGNYRL